MKPSPEIQWECCDCAWGEEIPCTCAYHSDESDTVPDACVFDINSLDCDWKLVPINRSNDASKEPETLPDN